MTVALRCSHTRSSGARCSRSARDGHETCAAHDPARPSRPKRAANVAKCDARYEAPAEVVEMLRNRGEDSTLDESMAGMGPQPWWCTNSAEVVRHHVQCMRDFAAKPVGGEDEEWTESRIRGHGVRALIALLQWLNEPEASTASTVSLAQQPAGPVAEPVEVVDAAPIVERAPRQLLAERGAEVWHADWRALLDRARELGGVDSLIVDAPYSERTHAGHDSGVDQSNRDTYNGKPSKRTPTLQRNALDYRSWDASDVLAFVEAWAPLVRGWMCSLTDHVLAPAWAEAMERVGRYAFAPIACVDVGSRIRLVGDGPSNWTTWLVVSRPKTSEFHRWGTLGGAYVIPEGARELRRTGVTSVVGGKQPWLMRALVRDYTRPGDLVCDPCCGAGTTGLAAIMEGRRALLGDAMEEHARLAVERLRAMPGETKAGQLALLGRESA